MLWSLFKILLFVALVAALAYGAQWLLSVSGQVLVTFNGQEYVLPPVVVVLSGLALMLALWVAFKLAGLLVATLRFINGDDTALTTYWNRNQEKKGLEALSDSLIALASGDAREAANKAQKAEKYLERPEVTNLIMAQAAEAAGETDRATEALKVLVTHERTRFVGIRGLMKQKLEAGDTETALKLAEKAFALKPKHVETQDTLLRLQAQDENWDGARKVLSAKLKSGALPKDVYRRREAVLSLADAREKRAKGEVDKANAEILEANRLSPELVPAAVMAARVHIANGDKRRAAKVLKAARLKTQHPDLAAAFAEIEPLETAEARIKRFQPFLKVAPEASDSHMLEAELNLAAEDFPGARRALGTTYETDPTTRSLTLMAAIERGEGASEAVVRGWLAKAVGAPRGPEWTCETCGTVHADWVPVCLRCESFDSLSWKRTETPAPTANVSSNILPLLTKSSSAALVATAPTLAGDPSAGPQDASATETAEGEDATVEAAEPVVINPAVVGTTRDVDETAGPTRS